MFCWLFEEGFTPTEAFARIKRPKLPETMVDILTDDEYGPDELLDSETLGEVARQILLLVVKELRPDLLAAS